MQVAAILSHLLRVEACDLNGTVLRFLRVTRHPERLQNGRTAVFLRISQATVPPATANILRQFRRPGRSTSGLRKDRPQFGTPTSTVPSKQFHDRGVVTENGVPGNFEGRPFRLAKARLPLAGLTAPANPLTMK